MNQTIDYFHTPATSPPYPHLVFIHGAGGDKSLWAAQKTFFLNLGWGVTILSLPGHGESEKVNIETVTDYATLLSKFLQHLDIDRCTLVGHSMGGGIAQEYALQQYRPVVDRLVLIGTGAKLKVNPGFFDLIENNFDQFLDATGTYTFHEETEIEIKLANREIMHRNGSDILLMDFKVCDRFDIREKMSSIKIPTLIICGEEDQMTPPNYSEYLHARLEQSDLHIVEKASHFVFIEQRDVVNHFIKHFHETIRE